MYLDPVAIPIFFWFFLVFYFFFWLNSFNFDFINQLDLSTNSSVIDPSQIKNPTVWACQAF